jgi:RimJ/RimL family protein N-acetyltransferase
MRIRHAEMNDLDAVLRLYERAREFMRASGNPSQWGDSHPPLELVRRDIFRRVGYVCTAGAACDDNGVAADREILGAFNFFIGDEPTYKHIEQGRWLNDEPYGVVHRLAVDSGGKGTGIFCLEWCMASWGNIRIDTHEDNAPMRRLLQKLKYTYCGIIHVDDGSSRLAFQKTAD